MIMDNREKILEATLRVYAEFGYRGATTRRIAEAAGVNEVTLFRRFGSKAMLIELAVRHHYTQRSHPYLPLEPQDPVREVTDWCRQIFTQLKETRELIQKFMSDLQQHPAMLRTVRANTHKDDPAVLAYMERLRELGLADQDFDPLAAAQMLKGALFGDIMSREMAPNRLPQPEEEAPERYAILFLRAIGVDTRNPGATTRSPQG